MAEAVATLALAGPALSMAGVATLCWAQHGALTLLGFALTLLGVWSTLVAVGLALYGVMA